jgi:hypothetical protein
MTTFPVAPSNPSGSVIINACATKLDTPSYDGPLCPSGVLVFATGEATEDGVPKVSVECTDPAKHHCLGVSIEGVFDDEAATQDESCAHIAVAATGLVTLAIVNENGENFKQHDTIYIKAGNGTHTVNTHRSTKLYKFPVATKDATAPNTMKIGRVESVEGSTCEHRIFLSLY